MKNREPKQPGPNQRAIWLADRITTAAGRNARCTGDAIDLLEECVMPGATLTGDRVVNELAKAILAKRIMHAIGRA